ncbi:MAG: DNA polymerase III subunit delta' [Halothermotrichaceae bacterium]
MSFKNVIGQKAAVRILQDEISTNRIHHSYLFLGKEGVGKKTLAVELAKALNCKSTTADNCEDCLPCKKINHGNHPDVRVVEIEEGKAIKIEQIRSLQKDIAYKPYESKHKVYIIDQAEQMTPQAANSLLKTLEEPPEYVVLILLAEEIDKLLPTVISRCQQIYLNSISKQLIIEQLNDKGINSEKVELIARLADGSLGRALNLAENEDFLKNRDNILKTLYNLPRLKTVKVFKAADKFEKLLKQEFPLFDLILNWYRDIILYNQGNTKQLVNCDYKDYIKKINNNYTVEELILIIELINNIKRYIAKNARKDLALQVMLFKIRAKRV